MLDDEDDTDLQTQEALPDKFGACCLCEGTDDVRNIVHLDFEAPAGFNGWGCVQCHAPMRGALALICDACAAGPNDQVLERLQFICGGKYLADRVRVPLAGYTRIPFGHNLQLHPESAA